MSNYVVDGDAAIDSAVDGIYAERAVVITTKQIAAGMKEPTIIVRTKSVTKTSTKMMIHLSLIGRMLLSMETYYGRSSGFGAGGLLSMAMPMPQTLLLLTASALFNIARLPNQKLLPPIDKAKL